MSPTASPLGQRIVRETARFAVLQALATVLAALANVALARLLERRDYGVYDICAFYIGLGSLLGDGGLGATLLRRRGEIRPEELRATVGALVLLASVLTVVVWIAAPWIAARNHFAASETWVLRAIAPLYLAGALRVVPYLRLERDIQFARIARIELAAGLAKHVVAVSLAASGAGVWTFVASSATASLVQLALAWRAAPGWVGLSLSWRTLKPLLGYGSQVQALGLCAYLKDNLARALLGSRLGPAPVGVFDFGLAYIALPVGAVNALARVQFPVYAQLTASDPDLFRALRGAMRTALLLGLPALGLLAFGAPSIVPVLYGAKWLESDPVIWGLVANMGAGLIASPLFTLLQAQGRAGLALLVFLGWTATTWALALVSTVYRRDDLGLLAHVHSVVTVVVVLALLAWAARHVRRALFREIASPVGAAIIAFAITLVLLRSFAFAPWRAALVFVTVDLLAVIALDGRTVRAEAKLLVLTVTRRLREPRAVQS